MEKVVDKKATIREGAKRFLEEQALIRSYLKGKTSKKTLNERGIKPKMPL